MSEPTPRREATRRRLIDAAITEFAARGIDATSVEQLCETAGFSRGAFYSNFATKDDLCLAIMEHHRDQIMAGLSEVFFRSPAAGTGVCWAISEALPEFFAIIAPTDEFRITLLEIRLRATRSPELFERVKGFSEETAPMTESFLERLAEQLGLKFRLPLQQIMEIMEAVFFHEMLQGDFDQPRLVVEAALALMDPIPVEHDG